MNIYHPKTFGNTVAAQVLVEKLATAEPRVLKKIGRFLSRYYAGFHLIKNIPEVRIKARLITLWYKDHLKKVPRIPESTEIETYLCNVLKAAHADIVRETSIPATTRRRIQNRQGPFAGH